MGGRPAPTTIRRELDALRARVHELRTRHAYNEWEAADSFHALCKAVEMRARRIEEILERAGDQR